MTKGLKLPDFHKEQWRVAGRTPLQMRTMTYNGEAAPWRGNHLMGTRLLPSNDDSDDIFSGTPLGSLELRSWSTRTYL
jgi:hypothetical protein